MPNRLLKPRRSARSIEPAQLFRRIADAIPHMLWTARPDGAVEFLNARFPQYTGMSAAQLQGWGWKSVLHPDDLAVCVQRWKRALLSGKGFEAEYRLRRADGKYRWHHHAVLPLRDADDRIVLWHGTCTDIDNQKRAAQRLEHARRTLESLVAARTRALEESGQRLRMVLDSMPAIAWIKDSQFRYVWVSASYGRVFGKSLQEIRGRESSDIWPVELARQYRRDDEKALRANGPVQSINDVPCADGRVVRLLVVKFPLPDETGGLGVAGIGFDIMALGAEKQSPGLPEPDDRLQRLSGRERQVLQLTVLGCTGAEVAERLGLSPKSVDTYRSRLMAKLEIEDLPALVKFAIRHGLTTIR